MIAREAMDLLRDDPAPALPVEYPESDGEPLGETDVHAQVTMALFHALLVRTKDRPDAYAAMDNFLYFEEGDPSACVSPDLYVVLGVEKKLRRTYKVWEEGRGPDLVIEVTSRKSRATDLGEKKGKYALLGVREYLLVDPLAEYLEPPLQGFRLGDQGYVRMAGEPRSELLGLILRWVDGSPRLVDAETGVPLPTPTEDHERAEILAGHSEREKARADVAEAELARLRALLTR